MLITGHASPIMSQDVRMEFESMKIANQIYPNPCFVLFFLALFFPDPQKKTQTLHRACRVTDEPLPDLPLPAPKRFKRSAPEPEEPPLVPEVPKAELSWEDGDEIMGNMWERRR